MKLLVPGRRVLTCLVGFIVLLMLGSVSAAGEAKMASHAPMRPLPTPSQRPLAKGTLYFCDPVKGDDRNDGSEAKPWKTVQRAVAAQDNFLSHAPTSKHGRRQLDALQHVA